jgi:hypothetical protein
METQMTSTHERLNRTDAEYARGTRREQVVLRKLKALGWDIEPSTREQNILHDVDAVRRCNDMTLNISIKSMSYKTYQKSKSILFEIDVLLKDTMTWVPSWFQTGKADCYVVDIEQFGLLFISKPGLVEYVNTHGWNRTTQNSPDVVRKQYVSGHPHLDAYSGLLRISDMLRADFAAWLELY